MIDLDTLQRAAQSAGFEVAGVAPVEPLGHGWYAPHVERLHTWIAEGMHADMEWIRERLHERVVPGALLPNVRSALVLFAPNATEPIADPGGARGRVSRYAWGRDYHNVIRKGLKRMRRWLSDQYPGVNTYACVDTGPVLERSWFQRAHVGWIGRSKMLIHPRLGTFGSLAVLFCDVELTPAEADHPFRCGTCTACIDECPTQAIGPNGVDARRCISFWTIEFRGLIPVPVRPVLGDWIFGCDICQDVCPWNNKAPYADPKIWQPQPDHAWPGLPEWIATDSDTLHARLHGSPLLRAGGGQLRRNAMIAAANLKAAEAIPAMWGVLRYDPDPILRATAAWSLRVLGEAQAADAARRDFDPMVQAEAHSLLPDDPDFPAFTHELSASLF